MQSLFELTGQVAVVTGGARGLGQALCEGLAAAGAAVAVLDLEVAACQETLQKINSLGQQGRAYACDVADPDSVEQAVQAVSSDFSRIDILINNAGITARIPTLDISPETVRHLTNVNYLGTFWMCQAVGRKMREQQSGKIVNMSALGGGLVGLGRGNAAYCATKGALAALTRDLACEWAPYHIRVNALAPSWFQTEMNATSIFSNPDFMRQVLTKLPLKRIGQPHDIIGPALFLVSQASEMITGLVLPVDGGAAATCPLEWNR